MPRNIAKPVSEKDAHHAARVARIVESMGDREVSLTYTKRDGTESSSVGIVRFFSGVEGMDTHSVTVETKDKGNRTINLHRVIGIK